MKQVRVFEQPIFMLLRRYILYAAAWTLTAIGFYFFLFLFTPERFQPRTKIDFMADYLVGKAILSGQNPYQPLSELAIRFGIPVGVQQLASPHPPPVVVATAPLGLLSYPHAVLAWLVISLLSLATSLALLLRWRASQLVLAFFVVVSWYPIFTELSLGQVMAVELVLLTIAYRLLVSNYRKLGGLLLGFAVAAKLITWPLIVLMFVKRRYASGFASIAGIATANLLSIIVIGPHAVVYYYTNAGAAVAATYQRDSLNFSLWNLGPRVFTGTHSIISPSLTTEPLIYIPQVSQLLSFALIVGAMLASFYIARQLDFPRGFSMLIATSISISPTAWWYYTTLLLLPISMVYRRGRRWLIVPLAFFPYLPQWTIWLFGSRLGFWTGLLLTAPLLSCLLSALLSAGSRTDPGSAP